MSLRSIALAALACAAATVSMTAATPASAADILVTPDVVAVSVSYADLNLASAAGRAQLDRRIANAARDICGSYQPLDLRMFSLTRACRADAIASARIPTNVASNDGALRMTGHRVSRAAN